MGKHYWKKVLSKALELEARGYTHRMVAEKLGYTYEQIKYLFKRYHANQRRAWLAPSKCGRPRKRPLSNADECKKRIAQLEMENELLRSFLQDVGRK